jgi:hypothetical protein
VTGEAQVHGDGQALELVQELQQEGGLVPLA